MKFITITAHTGWKFSINTQYIVLFYEIEGGLVYVRIKNEEDLQIKESMEELQALLREEE